MQFIINLIKKLFSMFTSAHERTCQTSGTDVGPNVTHVKPEVIMGNNTIVIEGAKMQEPKKTSTIITINNSKKFPYYTQRNNEVSPNQACNVTSMTMGLIYNGLIYKDGDQWYNKNGVNIYTLNKTSLPDVPYKQFEDNLMYYTRHDTKILEYYSRTYPNLYNDWVKEVDELTKNGVDANKYAIKSYPPNELHLVLSFAVNNFVGMGTITNYETQGIETIIRRIKNGESLVVSGTFEGLNHIVCVCGLQYELETGRTYGFIIDDPWHKTLRYKEKKTGDDSIITYDEFLQYVKPVNNKEKACHIFKR